MILKEILEKHLSPMRLSHSESINITSVLAPIAHLDVDKIKRKTIRQFVLVEEKNTVANLKLLKMFFRKLVKMGLMERTPVSHITYPVQTRTGFFLQESTIWDIYKCLEKCSTGKYHEPSRSSADILLCSVGLGQSVTTLVGLKVKDVNLENCEIRINKRTISFDFIAPPFREELLKRLEAACHNFSKSEYLFLKGYDKCRPGIPITALNKAHKKLRIKERLTGGSFRCAYLKYATHLQSNVLSYVIGQTAKVDLAYYQRSLRLLEARAKKQALQTKAG